MRLVIVFIFLFNFCLAQNSERQTLLDSLNASRYKDRGAFNLYIKKPEIEIIGGVFRDRSSATEGFEPVTFTYHVYLPFQLDLNYVNLKAGDKLMKLNTTLVVHHSKYGNYALGLGERFSFLLLKHLYLSYQVGIVWCEPVKYNTNDGINDMGFNMHHAFSLTYNMGKHFKASANVLHISNGHIFNSVKNNQDVIGVGVGYVF